MPKVKALSVKKRDKELFAPFDVVSELISSQISTKRTNADNRIIADILGEESVTPQNSVLPKETIDFIHSIMGLFGSYGRFDTHKKMFRAYPWNGKISKSEHIEATYQLFIHECYIFEERLKKFIDNTKLYAISQNIVIDTRHLGVILKIHKRVFKSALAARGIHVHNYEYKPREIERIGLLELFALPYASNSELKNISRMLMPQALKAARKKWIANCDAAKDSAEQIMKALFALTKPVWRNLKKESNRRRNKKAPQ
ncbi:MAG: hypothetical protein V4691_04715 [Pseudomonadota bacterium]